MDEKRKECEAILNRLRELDEQYNNVGYGKEREELDRLYENESNKLIRRTSPDAYHKCTNCYHDNTSLGCPESGATCTCHYFIHVEDTYGESPENPLETKHCGICPYCKEAIAMYGDTDFEGQVEKYECKNCGKTFPTRFETTTTFYTWRT